MLVRDAIPLIVAASAELLAGCRHEKADAVTSRLQQLRLVSIKAPEPLQQLAYLSSASAKIRHPSLAKILDACGHLLPWAAGDYDLPTSIAGKNTFVQLVGPEGPLVADEIRLGLYLQSPHCFYPPHNHAAEELYYLLSGIVEWQKDDDGFSTLSAPELIHHRPWQRHAMRTLAEPFLALWVWTGDIRDSTYNIDRA